MNRIKSFLRRFPFMYHSLRTVYYASRKILETYVFGTRIQEWIWSSRHLYRCNEWTGGYWEAKSHPRCQVINKEIAEFSPFSNILEIGCNTGPNLYWLGKRYPDVHVVGVDINPVAISEGSAFMKKEGIRNVFLETGKADDLGKYTDRSFDIVFTNATLIYVGPDKIKKVIKEMLRLGRKALILIEWHVDGPENDPHGLGIYNLGGWKRNYENLLRGYVERTGISITVNECFKDMGRDWEEFGRVIKIVL